MSYSRVTWEDRIKIKLLLQQGKNKSEIAEIIGKDKSTVGREIKRNTGGRGYRPKQAQMFAEEREAAKHRPYKMNEQTCAEIKKRLKKKWSPEQISNRLKLEKRPSVSAETIYKFVYRDKETGGELWRNLRRAHRSRKPRFPSENRRGTIKDARPISKRTKVANERKRVGHWERDTMLGLDRKMGILALVDRKTRFNKFIKLNRRTAPKVTAATIKALKGLPIASITNDRGHEFADHKSCADKLGVKIYLCDPYTSCQRGTNENRIGILRQYFPKRTDLKKVSPGMIRKVEFEINNRPMKCLDWKTTYEVMMRKSCTRKC
jgi:IS30 family transposase